MCCKIYILHLKYFIAIIMFTYNTMVFYKDTHGTIKAKHVKMSG